MKKLFFAFCMMMICSSQVAMAQSKTKAKTAETKVSILKALRTEVSGSMIKDGISKEKSEKFADCFTTDLGSKLTLEELKIFYQLNTMENEKEKEELAKKAEKMGIRTKMEMVGKNCGSVLQ